MLSNGSLETFVQAVSSESKLAHVAGLLAIATFHASREEKEESTRSELLDMCLDSVRTLCGLIEYEESSR